MKTTKRKEKIKSITIIGKRWFDKINGNTYCSARVLINGKTTFAIPWTYGYGEYYKQRAIEELEKLGYIKLGKYENGMSKSFREFCEDNKITFEHYHTEGLKREMIAWGIL